MTEKDTLEAAVLQQIDDSIKVKNHLKNIMHSLIEIADEMARLYHNGNKVLLFGNGGSAADAQHIAAELMGKYYMERAPLPAVALTVNSSVLTAIANDYGYQDVFARQVRALVNRGDMAIGLSTSGKSLNVINGLTAARERGAVTVAFVGQSLWSHGIADYIVPVSSTDTPRIQEAHITAGHLICYIVERLLFARDSTKK